MHDFDFHEEYDDYIKNRPLEARFDPTTIQMLVVEAIPKHRAYDMMFDEYLKERHFMSEHDTAERKRLSFYLPLYQAMRSQDFSVEYKITVSHFLTSIVELGLIIFKQDYAEEMSIIKSSRRDMAQYLTSERASFIYMHMNRQTIELDSCSKKGGKYKHYTPTCQDWLYDTMTSDAGHLNMTVSDLAYLCWCLGLQKTTNNNIMDPVTDRIIHKNIDRFNLEINILTGRIKSTLDELSVCSELLNHTTS